MNTTTRKQAEYTVYVIELHPDVLLLGRFAETKRRDSMGAPCPK